MAGSWYRLFSHLALENSTLVRHRLLNDVTRSGRPVEMHKKNNGDPWKFTKSDNSFEVLPTSTSRSLPEPTMLVGREHG